MIDHFTKKKNRTPKKDKLLAIIALIAQLIGLLLILQNYFIYRYLIYKIASSKTHIILNIFRDLYFLSVWFMFLGLSVLILASILVRVRWNLESKVRTLNFLIIGIEYIFLHFISFSFITSIFINNMKYYHLRFGYLNLFYLFFILSLAIVIRKTPISLKGPNRISSLLYIILVLSALIIGFIFGLYYFIFIGIYPIGCIFFLIGLISFIRNRSIEGKIGYSGNEIKDRRHISTLFIITITIFIISIILFIQYYLITILYDPNRPYSLILLSTYLLYSGYIFLTITILLILIYWKVEKKLRD